MTDIPPGLNIEGDNVVGNANIGGTQNFFAPVTMQAYAPDATPTSAIPSIPVEKILQAFDSATSRLAHIRNTFANTNIRIDRHEVNQILEWINLLTANVERVEQKLALVTGKPGQGKSVVMQQLAEALRDAGRVVLGIKADDLAAISKPILSLDDLQVLLQMPAPIEQCVRVVAKDRSCIVLIDQVDTLALTLNTDEQSLRVVINLIDRLREIAGVQIIVSCRDFERQHDPVLGGIKTEKTFSIGNLNEDEINRVLLQLNQSQIQDLPKSLQHLLRTPLYLDVYAQIVLSDEYSNAAQISTLQDLYGRLWMLRIERSERNAPPPLERRQAVFHLVELMQRQRKLKLHVSALDDYPTVRQYFQRMGFIIEEAQSLSFLHQTLFSYCYARKFASEQRLLSAEIFSSPQGFFERQLMVEVLQHLRSTDLETYHSELTRLLFPPEENHIRYHLRLLLLKWLTWQSNPVDQEYALIVRLERTNHDDFQRWLRGVGKNDGWFLRLKDDLPRWLSSRDNHIVTMAVQYLANFRDSNTKYVIELIEPYLDRSEEWNQHIAWLLLYLENWEVGNNASELLMHLVREGTISFQASNHSLVGMAKSNPVAGCQLIKLHCELAFNIYLDLMSRQSDPYARPRPDDALKEAVDSWETRGFILSVAQSNPQAMLDYLFPWFIHTIIELAKEKQHTRGSAHLLYWFDELDEINSGHDREGISLAHGIERSLIYLAHTDPVAFRKRVSDLASIDARIVQQLLMRAFRANASEYVTDIYEFLTEDDRRIRIQPDARYLLGAAFRYSDQTLRDMWERFLFAMPQIELKPEEKSLKNWRRDFRWWQVDQLDFLLSVDEALLSENARRKKYEMLRLPEFENHVPFDMNGIGVMALVPAPVSPDKQQRLSDADWLRIMRRYDEETGR